MRNHARRLLALLLACAAVMGAALAAPLEEGVPVELTSPSAMLLEADTGTVIFEKNADEKRQVASVTKLMTLLICFEELEAGRVSLEDDITVSQAAAAQIGSQALLDANAVYKLRDLLHATIIASANDAAYALAEHIAGSEAAFVEQMNQRAAELGMESTFYTNPTGLPDSRQYTTARDVAALACEVCRHPDYFTHASVWMDTLTHPGGRVTDLTNTNRLVRFYDGCDGLKTGSADASKYCLCATAQKNGLRLIAIVLGTDNSQKRFNEARAMLDYGFAGYKRVVIFSKGDRLGRTVPVHLGMKDTVEAAVGAGLSMLLKPGQEKQLSLEVELPEQVAAPINAGDAIGIVRVKLGDTVIAKLSAVAAEDVGMPGLLSAFLRLLANWR
ncbi:MAG: D-alanyl-D-alanine carboxypeptidase [Clostridiales bacterium]|nr:D-alanyl-D-alanine carboxypeptidase [Clostridiales bacterium]MDO4350329.1 D-alanyl-D-alanine carboxypeptidase family protein [Eubacteriales bacterium]MDY4007821.1 D-alanyl-D-alanine carboxypeptidase family protein [Candidatus Limiplasma sp.]